MTIAEFFNGLQQPLLYAVLVSGVLLLVDGLYRLLIVNRRRSEDRVNRRLKMLAEGVDPLQTLDIIRRTEKRPHWLLALQQIFPFITRLDRLIGEAGAAMSLQRLLLQMTILSSLVLFGLRILTPMPEWALLLLSLSVGIGGPIVVLLRTRRRRLTRFTEQLPDALELLVRTLRVGHPLSSSIALVANEMPDPIGSEFGIAFDEMTYGLGIREAVENLGRRVDVPDLHYIIVAINIQHGTGGNLAEVLEGLSRVIRGRMQMYLKIRAVSAEGRASALFLTFFPFVPSAFLYFMQPDLYINASSHPYFWPIMMLGVVMCIMNSILMHQVTKIRV